MRVKLTVSLVAVSTRWIVVQAHARGSGYNFGHAMERLLEATYRAEQDHFWFRGFRRFVAPLLAAASPRPKDATQILDCGCGTGANLQMLSRYGRPFGFDLTERGLQFGRGAGLTRIARASVTAIPFPTASFDIATSFDVLYSLTDTQEAAAVTEMHRILRPGGGLVLNVAALEMLRGNISEFSGELRRYDRPRLRRSLERAGFTIERLTYTNAMLFPMIAAVRFAQRLSGSTTSQRPDSDFEIPAAPVNAALSGLLHVEATALRLVDMPFGSSLLCLARKR
jgi:SAM-dependent methyltransferase